MMENNCYIFHSFIADLIARPHFIDQIFPFACQKRLNQLEYYMKQTSNIGRLPCIL